MIRTLKFKGREKFDNSSYFKILGIVWWPALEAWYKDLGTYSLNRTRHIAWKRDTSKGALKVYGSLKETLAHPDL